MDGSQQDKAVRKGLINKGEKKKKREEVASNNGVTPDQRQETPSLL